jgi:hypothetical protein
MPINNKEIKSLVEGIEPEKMPSHELLTLVNKLKLMHEATKLKIMDLLDEEDFLILKYIEIMKIIESRVQ